MRGSLFLLSVLFCLSAVQPRRFKRQEDGQFWFLEKEGEEQVDEKNLGSVESIIQRIIEKGPPGAGSSPHPGQCVCVPHYNCDLEKGVITDGNGIIDVRIANKSPGSGSNTPIVAQEKELIGGNCPGSIEVCCKSPTLEPNPGNNKESIGIVTGETQSPDEAEKEGRPAELVAEKHISVCGNRNSDGINVRVTSFKNQEAQYGEFPWMVAILSPVESSKTKDAKKYVCGGSLIHPQVVLTAAHCVQGREPAGLIARLGEWDTQSNYEQFPQQDIQVADMVIHEAFIKANLFNDVALLFLETPVNLGPEADTICMPIQGEIFDGSRCWVSGWGKDQFGKAGTYQLVMKKIDLRVVPRTPCQTSLRTTRLGKHFILDESFICAGGEKGKDACKGDGGSPLVCPIKGQPDRYVQAGIVAWGIGCGENGVPGVYVNVPGFVNWIEEKISKKLNFPAGEYFKSHRP